MVGPDRSELPFLIAYGDWIWKVVLVACVVVVIAGRRWLRGVFARRAARLERDRLRGRVVTELQPGAGVVRGTLRGDAIASVEIEPPRGPEKPTIVKMAASPATFIEVDGRRVELDGIVNVRHGSRAETRVRALPGGMPSALTGGASDLRVGSALLRVATPGDVILVQGELTRRAGASDSASYRDSSEVWTIAGDDEDPIEVVSEDFVELPMATGIGAHVFHAVMTVIGVGLAMLMLGEHVRPRDGDAPPETGRPLDIRSFDAMAIAAATPNARDDALKKLEDDLTFHRYRDERTLTRLLTVLELRGNRDEMAELLYEHDRFEEALALARRNGDRRVEWAALVALGRFDEVPASLLGDDSDEHAVIPLIAAGRWREAAEAADRWAASERDGAHDDSAYHHCLAELFRYFDGDVAAEARIRGATEGCRWSQIVITRPEERARKIAEIDLGKPAEINTITQLAWAYGLPLRGYRVPSLTDATFALQRDDMIGDEELWLMPKLLEILMGIGDHRLDDAVLSVRASTAYLEVIRGDLEKARELARAHDAGRDRNLQALLELHGSRIDIDVGPAREFFPAVGLRAGNAPAGIDLSECRDDAVDLLRRAQDGDGQSLAVLLQGCRPWEALVIALAIAPRLQTGRAQVAEAIAWMKGRGFVSEKPRLFDRVHHAALKRDIFRLLGADDEAARWQRIVDRHLGALSDTRRVIALILWSR